MLEYYLNQKRRAEIKRDLLVESLLAKINESTVELAKEEITLTEFFKLIEDLKERYKETVREVSTYAEAYLKEAEKVGKGNE